MAIYNPASTFSAQFGRPDRIMVGTDLRDADVLLPYAIEQAKKCGAELMLVHAAMNPNMAACYASGAVPSSKDLRSDFEATELMESMVAQVRDHGIVCGSIIAHLTVPDTVLRQEVQRIGAKRLIMATHGRGKIGRFALGSVARELLNTLNTPIFLVGPHARAELKHYNPRRILHPVSFCEGYEQGVELSRSLAELYDAELILMHVLDPDIAEETNPARTARWAKQALDEAIPNRAALSVRPQTDVVAGDTVDEIVAAAEMYGADWIILGTTHLHKPRLLFDGTAYKVLAQAKMPVLALPLMMRPSLERVEHERTQTVIP